LMVSLHFSTAILKLAKTNGWFDLVNPKSAGYTYFC